MRVVRTLALVLFALGLLWLGGPAAACTTILVGKEASAERCVLIAHNEDDDPPQLVVHTKVPRTRHAAGDTLRIPEGPTLAQVPETWAFLWTDLPGCDFSQSGLNEWGVCVTSDNCPSREEHADLVHGGIGPTLRRLIIERARTARDGVRLAGRLVERFGYQAPGRTYVIGDPEEAWLLSIVRGHHWLAWRVPDDEVCVLENSYVVRRVDLADTNHVMASADLVEYAVKRGWYDPQRDGPLDFARVFADSLVARHPANVGRQWAGLRRFTAVEPDLGPDLPASVKPARPVGLADLMTALRDHYEGTELAHPQAETGDPHPGAPGTVCARSTQGSFVAQLRRGDRPEVDLVYWASLGRPCTSCFVPFHYGIGSFPSGWETPGAERPDAGTWRAWSEAPFRADEGRAYATAVSFQGRVEGSYAARIGAVRRELDAVEARALALQPSVEEEARALWSRDPAAAGTRLREFARETYRSALEAMSRALP